MSKNIGIIGCGWLGLPLAKSLKEHGHAVYGTTTAADKIALLQDSGIVPFQVRLSEGGISGNIHDFLLNAEVLIINVPPKLRGATTENYVAKMRHLYTALKTSAIKKVIFISSTSVYGAAQGTLTEDTLPQPTTEAGKQILASENIFRSDSELNTTIIRFGGLIGPNRHPVYQLSGRKDLTNGDQHINLIHLNDCIRVIRSVLKKDLWDQVFNAVYPYHPTKRDYYTAEALKRGLVPPNFLDKNTEKIDKIIKSNHFNVKNYLFHTSIIS
ncbi:Nucleoside-diphosphate-sugar epimerase [Arenibacter nanhaiticus]|uniref:Nucleoside-diphosphate-sugar epimerase n=1 Tax=Arenibacter nanhaiticus TaxID=558155 RepID=A0A1M6LL57_9FLAO|nr:SDR family oxidoreductase [Arenibacter nanhaiticus]SHJ71883.1 Nucleoside-diphosphate-sugar epimerase [Arenibacter nanhaiticus]